MRDRQSANFSTELPSALRNLAGTNSFCSTDDEDDCEQEDSLSGFIVPHIDVRSLSDIRRQTLINEFKKVIAELEGTMEDRHPILPAPTPPPRPSAGMPRNRKNWTHTTPTVEDTRPATDGLYGADNADVDYWSGFDQAYDAAEKSFDSGSSSEDLRTQQWRAAMGKWVEKGVGVMKPLDEESLDSNSSFKTSPVGKKEVRWRDEVSC